MAETRDVISSLVDTTPCAAFYLAKAGCKPLVLERRHQVGGAAITEDFQPVFRCPTSLTTLAHFRADNRADIMTTTDSI